MRRREFITLFKATDLIDVRSLYDANQGDGFMNGMLFAGFLLLSSQLVGSEGVAQAVEPPTQHIDGKSLATPEQQRSANDAMNTPSGQMGKDEPGAHALRENETDMTSKPSGGRPQRPSSPPVSEQTSSQR